MTNENEGHEPLDIFTMAMFIVAIVIGGIQGLVLGLKDLNEAIAKEQKRARRMTAPCSK